jgi:hypothetical protein
MLADGTGQKTPGVLNGYTWSGTVWSSRTSALPPTVARVQGGLRLQIDGDACATGWYIAYGPPPPPAGPEALLVAGLLTPTVVTSDPAVASQDRLVLEAPPPGRWVIQAVLQFGTGYEGLTWLIDVGP